MTAGPARGPALRAPAKALYAEFLARCVSVLGPDDAATVAKMTDRRLRAIRDGTLGGDARDPLERRWYASLAAGAPDYGVYDDLGYVAETWCCWIVYARKYLRAVADGPVLAALGPIRSVADVGCGIGYSCAAWREIAPAAEVVGTNFPASPQGRIAASLGALLGFRVQPRLTGPADVLFASEYFEHFPAPVDHLAELLEVARPRAVVAASTFGSPSVGHFPTYLVGGSPADGRATSRAFSAILREAGFAKLDTGFWNNRPSVWVNAQSRRSAAPDEV